jgi:tRNA(adenine34) deaminase
MTHFGTMFAIMDRPRYHGEPMAHPPDDGFMKIALEEARKAAEDGEVPVGAVVVRDGVILARGRNAPRSLIDPTAHAEIAALREASRVAGNYRLPGADLYVTIEPCLMCVGAAVHARVRRIVYGAADPKSGATWVLHHDWPGTSGLNHRVELTPGIEEASCSALLRRFFAAKR